MATASHINTRLSMRSSQCGCLCVGVRHKVYAAGMQRVAFADAAHAEPAAAQSAMVCHRIKCVMGTRWIEATSRRHHGADSGLIKPDNGQDDAAHARVTCAQCLLRLFNSMSPPCFAAPGLAMTTQSTPGKFSGVFLKLSRTILFSRFRGTASPAALREIAIPRRA